MDFLKHIVFINLEKRKDRLAEITGELAKMELDASRFNAIAETVGLVGCGKSHTAVLKMARENEWPYVLILEDDFQFIVDKDNLKRQMELLTDYAASNTFDVCFLSYNMVKSDHIPGEKNFIKAVECQTASGYIVMKHYYTKLIDLYEWAIPLLQSTGHHWIYANDQIWKQYQKTDKWIAFSTRLGIQRPSYSDNAMSFQDYKV